jgi:CRISPR-associated protein Cmr4
MNQKILYLFTRTPLHVGAGSNVGAIDLPIQRERHTRHPIIPGSSIKGVLRYTAESLDGLDKAKIKDMFGPELVGENADKEARAGELVFGEARPLAFPVRSAKGAFAFISCPLVLQRFARENALELPDLAHPEDQSCFAGSKVVLADKKKVVLEEYAFSWSGGFPGEWEGAVKGLIADPVWKEAAGRLVLLSDGDFSHFVATTTEISQHVRIDPRTGAVAKGALFNLESVPAETLFFAPVQIVKRPANPEKGHYQSDSAKELIGVLDRHPVLQFGGNSTTGRGFCSVKLVNPQPEELKNASAKS